MSSLCFLYFLLESDKAEVNYPANARHCWLLNQSKVSLANPQSFLLQKGQGHEGANQTPIFLL